MSTTILVILLAVGAVGLFVLGMYITLMVKGHHIDSEIGENKNMQKLGIKCAAQQMREEESEYYGIEECTLPGDCSPGGCSTCGDYPSAGQK